MKKILIAIALVGISYSGYSEVTILKNGRGLLGRWYKYVEENDGIVSCSDPGFTRCKPLLTALVFSGDPTPLTETDFDTIDDYVSNAVTASNSNGTLIYNSEYYITYNYNVVTDQLVIRILSITEAQEQNLIN